MGIKNLKKFLKDKCPAAITTILMTAFKGHKVAIDTSGWLYANIAVLTSKEIKLTDVAHHEIDFTAISKELKYNLLNFTEMWLNHGVTPVYVYDGESPPEKAETRLQRVESKM